MDNDTVNDDTSNIEINDTQVVAQETDDPAALKKERDELAQTNRQLFERAKKAEGFVKVDGKWVKAPKPEEAVATKNELKATASELEAAQLDFFDLKGYSEPDEVAIFQNIMKRTGMSHREVIKDDYALAKIKSLRDQRDVLKATPSSTKRGGQPSADNVELALAKFESTGELPTDFALRSKVINAKVAQESTSKPAWRR